MRRWLLVPIMAVLVAGCGGRRAPVPFQHEAVWRMAPSETGIPAPRSLCVATNGELSFISWVQVLWKD